MRGIKKLFSGLVAFSLVSVSPGPEAYRVFAQVVSPQGKSGGFGGQGAFVPPAHIQSSIQSLSWVLSNNISLKLPGIPGMEGSKAVDVMYRPGLLRGQRSVRGGIGTIPMPALGVKKARASWDGLPTFQEHRGPQGERRSAGEKEIPDKSSDVDVPDIIGEIISVEEVKESALREFLAKAGLVRDINAGGLMESGETGQFRLQAGLRRPRPGVVGDGSESETPTPGASETLFRAAPGVVPAAGFYSRAVLLAGRALNRSGGGAPRSGEVYGLGVSRNAEAGKAPVTRPQGVSGAATSRLAFGLGAEHRGAPGPAEGGEARGRGLDDASERNISGTSTSEDSSARLSRVAGPQEDSWQASSGHDVGPSLAESLNPFGSLRKRSAIFYLVPAGLTGSLWLALNAVSRAASFFVQSSAGAGYGWATAAFHFALTGAGVLTASFLALAAAGAALYAYAMWKGRNVTEEQAWRFVEKGVSREGWDPGLIGEGGGKGVLRFFRSRSKFPTFLYGYPAGNHVYIRRELVAVPWLFRVVLAHELRHLKTYSGLSPPRSFLGRAVNSVLEETLIRIKEIGLFHNLKKARISHLHRVLQASKISLRLPSPFEVLVVDAGKKQNQIRKDLAYLSQGKARPRFVNLDSGEIGTIPSAKLYDQVRAQFVNLDSGRIETLEGMLPSRSRFRAIVLNKSSRWIPEGNPDRKLLEHALRGFGMAFAEVERLLSKKPNLSSQAKARITLLFRGMYEQRLKVLAPGRLAETIYNLLPDNGVAVLPFSPDEKGLSVLERVFGYYVGSDLGAFRVTRVDLGEGISNTQNVGKGARGDHAIVLQKVEPRVEMWLTPKNGETIKSSLINVSGTPEKESEARKVLNLVGLGEYADRFNEMGVEIRHIFGTDFGENRVYITLPKRMVPFAKRWAAQKGVRLKPSKSDFKPQLIVSGRLTRVPDVWKEGFEGRGIKISWIDTGLDIYHPYFQNRMDVEDLVNEGPEDWLGHGSNVAGISAANGGKWKGAAPEAIGKMVKVFSRGGFGASEGDIMAGGVVAMEYGAPLIGLSLSGRGGPNSDLSRFFSNLATKENSEGQRPAVFVSASNSGPFDQTIGEPAAGRNVIAVGAATKGEEDGTPRISFFSAVGPSRDKLLGRWEDDPDIISIGGNVNSVLDSRTEDAFRYGVESVKSQHMSPGPSDSKDGLRTKMSGTSMSAPLAMAVGALIWEVALKVGRRAKDSLRYFIKESPFAIKAVLQRSSDDMGLPWQVQGAGLVNASQAKKLTFESFGSSLRRRWGARVLGRFLGRESSFSGSDSEESWEWLGRLEAVKTAGLKPFLDAKETKERYIKEEAEGDEPVSSQVRSKAAAKANLVIQISKGEQIPNLVKALSDPVWLIRRTAGFELGNFKDARAVMALAEAAVNDPDPRVRQMAFWAIGETKSHKADGMLQAALHHESRDIRVYSALALAKHGDGSGLSHIVSAIGESAPSAPARQPAGGGPGEPGQPSLDVIEQQEVLPDRQESEGSGDSVPTGGNPAVRFSACWASGQVPELATAELTEALAQRVKDSSDLDDVRHVAASALANIALKNPDAVSDKAFVSLLETAEPDEMVLISTLLKFFSISSRKPALVRRMREGSLRSVIMDFIQENRQWTRSSRSPLGKLVDILARAINVRIDIPSPPQDPGGRFIPGVDPTVGPVHLIVGVPREKGVIRKFTFFRDGPGVVEIASSELGLDPSLISRYEGTLRATIPRDNAVTLEVPDERKEELMSELRGQGFTVREAEPVFPLLKDTGPLSQMPEVWGKDFKGQNVTVAVVDEGLDVKHPAFKGRIRAVKNFTDEGGPDDVTKESIGHGTHVGGIAAGQSVKGSPYVGMAPEAKIVAAKVLGKYGGTSAQVMEGQAWAASLSKDPLKDPIIINESLGGPGSVKSPLARSATRIVLDSVGFAAAVGNSGPREDTMGVPAKGLGVFSVAAVDKKGKLTSYSSRGKRGEYHPSVGDYGGGAYFGRDNPYEIISALNTGLADSLKDKATTVWWPDRETGEPLYQFMSGSSMSSPHVAGKLVVLTGIMLQKMITLPEGYFLWLSKFVKELVTKTDYEEYEIGAGIFNNMGVIVTELLERLKDPDKVSQESKELLEELRKKYEEELLEEEEQDSGWVGPPDGFVGTGGKGDVSKPVKILQEQPPAREKTALLRQLKQVLSGGAVTSGRRVSPFTFRPASGGKFVARSAGLEGFLYSKLELDRGLGIRALLHHVENGHYFNHIKTLISGVPELEAMRKELESIKNGGGTAKYKNTQLNKLLIKHVKALQDTVEEIDSAGWGRNVRPYMILSRAYNRLKRGKNFFDSLDKKELSRIKETPSRPNTIWLMDIFKIGKIRRWGTGGGSPYAIMGYHVKPELGGDEALKAFVERAHRMGFKVMVDFIPNHVSLDSEMIKNYPEAFIHVVPDQSLSDKEIMDMVPREAHGERFPKWFLIETDRYPEGGRRVHKRILVHHPAAYFEDRLQLWIDLAQIDYSRSVAWEWQLKEARRLFKEFDIDAVRRDMMYELISSKYYRTWIHRLSKEAKEAHPKFRRLVKKFISEFDQRWKDVKHREFPGEMSREIKEVKESAVAIDEAYSRFTDLSRSGSDAVYNKNDHNKFMGQIGLYDAIVSRKASRIRAALQHIAFTVFQRGGASLVNFMGTHDAGEGNPVDKFGKFFKAAAMTALLLPTPTLFYNGQERGVGQREGLIGDLEKSEDLKKDIPFDIPVKINWKVSNPGKKAYLKLLSDKGKEHKEIFENGVMDALEPEYGKGPVVAWTLGRRDAGESRVKALLLAANFSDQRGASTFRFKPILSEFGAFVSRPDRTYIFRDVMDIGAGGKPKKHIRSGKQLLERGLYIELASGGRHLFEIEEVSPAGLSAASLSPQTPNSLKGVQSASPKVGQPRSFARGVGNFLKASWDTWTQRLTDSTVVLFTVLQVPQIITNFSNLVAGDPAKLSILPWTGYSAGIIGNALLLSLAVFSKEKSWARVQLAGVLTTSFVLSQIYAAGYAPALFFWPFVTALGVYSALLVAEWFGKLPEWLHSKWGKIVNALGWAATLLFMYAPMAQLYKNFVNPAQIAGLSALTLVIAMTGNLLMLPRSVQTENRIWFTGVSWGAFLGGWAVLRDMFAQGALGSSIFWPLTVAVPLYIYFVLKMTQKSKGYSSIWKTLGFMVRKKAPEPEKQSVKATPKPPEQISQSSLQAGTRLAALRSKVPKAGWRILEPCMTYA